MLSLLFSLLLLVPWVSGFECSDGCVVESSYLDDNYCDCTKCGDESEWTCNTCPAGCPTTCGAYVYCTGTPVDGNSSHTTTEAALFTCDDGCEYTDSYVDDGFCDCSQCEDESEWSCETCGGCPTVCDDSVECQSQGTTTEAPLVFTCDDGCEIKAVYENDAFCDCTNCEDEPNWSCDSCGGCPLECGSYVICSVQTTETPVVFTCNDGCDINEIYENDEMCDCIECEDESIWSCESCGGCPLECGDYVECGVTTTLAPYMCDDNCTMTEEKLNDGFCDCGECEDEENWNCDSCGGCPLECGDRVNCDSTTEAPQTTEADFVCNDGCVLTQHFVDDDWCDCSECEDEPNWTCNSCDGCPAECGGYTYCGGLHTTAETHTTAMTDLNNTETTEEGKDAAAALRLLLATVFVLLSVMTL